MAEKKKLHWHMYHMYDNKMVVDEGESIMQLRAHYKGDPKFENDVIACVLEPLDDTRLKAYMNQYQLTHDPAKRQPLKSFTPAPSTRRLRG